MEEEVKKEEEEKEEEIKDEKWRKIGGRGGWRRGFFLLFVCMKKVSYFILCVLIFLPFLW